MPEDSTLSRKYLGVLSIAAVAIIAVGLVTRDALMGPNAPQSAPPSEASALQRFSEENQLRGISTYISGRVTAVGPMVVRVPTRDASGLRWGARDTIITTSPERPVFIVEPVVPDTVRTRFAVAEDSLRRDWLLVVARDPGERLISWYGIHGGRSFGRCGARVVEKLMLGLPLTREFSGAGIFDLDGRVRGMIVDCGSELAAIPEPELRRLLADTTMVLPPGDSAADDSSAGDTTRTAR